MPPKLRSDSSPMSRTTSPAKEQREVRKAKRSESEHRGVKKAKRSDSTKSRPIVGDTPTAPRSKRRRSASPSSPKHTRYRSHSRQSSPLAGEIGKKFKPKHLTFETMGKEEVNALGCKSAWESILHNHCVDFGKNAYGEPQQPPRIPLCRLMPMQVVRKIQEADVEYLRDQFYKTGYVSGQSQFYLTVKNPEGESRTVAEFQDQWDPLWTQINKEFEAECDKVDEFKALKDTMFWVFDGNHRLTAWAEVALQHPHKREYHPCVRATILAPAVDAYRKVEQAMHDLNSYGFSPSSGCLVHLGEAR